jgi:hypothetical protein
MKKLELASHASSSFGVPTPEAGVGKQYKVS